MSVIAIAKQRMTCFSNLAGSPTADLTLGLPRFSSDDDWDFRLPTWGISQDFRCYCGSCRPVSGFPAFNFSIFSFILSFVFVSLFHFFFSLVSVVSSVNLLLNTLQERSTRLLVLGHLHLSIGGLGMQGGKAWVRRAYSVALNGLWNGVVSVLWKSASGHFSILVFYTLCLLLDSRIQMYTH